MIEVKFKTLIPNAVKNWIYEKGYEDPLSEASIRLHRAFCQTVEFKSNGLVLDIEYDENKQMIGVCVIGLEVEDEKAARSLFSELFSYVIRKGQKFKFVSFKCL